MAVSVASPISSPALHPFAKWVAENDDISQCFYVHGQVVAVNSVSLMEGKKQFEHEIVCASRSQFERPSSFTLTHGSRIGQPGEVVSLVVRSQMWVRAAIQSKKPDANGELNAWKPQGIRFELVEKL